MDVSGGDAGFDYCRYLADHLTLHAFISTRLGEAMPTTADGMEALIRNEELQAAVSAEWRAPYGTAMGPPERAIENALRLYAPMCSTSPVELTARNGELGWSDGRHRLCVASRERLSLAATVHTVDGESRRIRERYMSAAQAIADQRWGDALPILEEVMEAGDLEIATRACREIAWAQRTLGNWPACLEALAEAVVLAESGTDGLTQVMTHWELADSCRKRGDVGAEIEAHVTATHAGRAAIRERGFEGLWSLAERAAEGSDAVLGTQVRAAIARSQLSASMRIGLEGRLEGVGTTLD